MKVKYPINLHKGSTFLFVFGLMLIYQNFTTPAWVYLALHGGYGILWLCKDAIYPDKQWEQEISFTQGIFAFILVSSYWIAPFILISSGKEVVSPLLAAAIAMNIIGVFLHYSSDAQKYYTLKYQQGLITEGFFARSRNPNYLGEVLIYLSFAMLAQHWLPFLVLGGFVAGLFVPNMLKKDKSLSRYPQFAEYQNNSSLLIPKFWGNKSAEIKADMNESTTT